MTQLKGKRKKAKITNRKHTFKNYAGTYNVEILNSVNPELQLEDTESAIKSKVIELLTQLKNFKFVTTLVLVFKKIEKEGKTKSDNFYSCSKAKLIINDSYIDDVFHPIDTKIIKSIQKVFRKKFRLDC